VAKAPSTPSTPSGGSDNPSWTRDQQNPITPDSDSADQRDVESGQPAGTARTGTAQDGTTQQ
jgi:hypothetical protein